MSIASAASEGFSHEKDQRKADALSRSKASELRSATSVYGQCGIYRVVLCILRIGGLDMTDSITGAAMKAERDAIAAADKVEGRG